MIVNGVEYQYPGTCEHKPKVTDRGDEVICLVCGKVWKESEYQTYAYATMPKSKDLLTPKQIVEQKLILTRGGVNPIKSYRQIWRIIKSGRIKSTVDSTGHYLVKRKDIIKYNNDILSHKMLDI
ncbi:MAG: hypothetical protein M0R80_17545 [Proteobacteria bacterium]|nr:hypothetical protein [Pseudomonadota bacterium]